MDPRVEVIDRRLAGVERIVAVTGGKGGIGKSSVASCLALALARRGDAVGLLDLDFCGPSTHVILGIRGVQPVEERGFVPPVVHVSGADHGIRFMSITHFAGDNPAPLRGADISNAMIELLAVTQWGDLDCLVVDMPPGLSDSILDTVRLIKRAEFLTVTTPSAVALETVKKVLRLLRELRQPVLGIVENMRRGDEPSSKAALAEFEAPFLGSLPFDAGFELALGDTDRLDRTAFMTAIRSALAQADL